MVIETVSKRGTENMVKTTRDIISQGKCIWRSNNLVIAVTGKAEKAGKAGRGGGVGQGEKSEKERDNYMGWSNVSNKVRIQQNLFQF